MKTNVLCEIINTKYQETKKSDALFKSVLEDKIAANGQQLAVI